MPSGKPEKLYRIAVLPGDGIGPEVVQQAVKVVETIGEVYGHKFDFAYGLIGGAAVDETGSPLPEETLKLCQESDAILLGAVGGPKWDGLPPEQRPEKALLSIRKILNLFANLRPVKIYHPLASCPLKDEIAQRGIDIMFVRQLTGGIYFGEKQTTIRGDQVVAMDVMEYSKEEIEDIARIAFETALKRRKKVTSVDKANVLETSRLWRKTVEEVGKKYPQVELEHMLVDSCAMQLITRPYQFDVVLTGNMFGDILSDEGSVLSGSIGMMPSVSFGSQHSALYEPVHGSAPDIAGQNKANPLAAIISAAMMLKLSLHLEEEGAIIEDKIKKVLAKGYRTPDIMEPGKTRVGTQEMGQLIINEILKG